MNAGFLNCNCSGIYNSSGAGTASERCAMPGDVKGAGKQPGLLHCCETQVISRAVSLSAEEEGGEGNERRGKMGI